MHEPSWGPGVAIVQHWKAQWAERLLRASLEIRATKARQCFFVGRKGGAHGPNPIRSLTTRNHVGAVLGGRSGGEGHATTSSSA